jgi:hypothetical protein
MVDGNRLSGPKMVCKRGFTKDGEAGRECRQRALNEHSAGERVTELCVLKWLSWGDDVKQQEGPILRVASVFKPSRCHFNWI